MSSRKQQSRTAARCKDWASSRSRSRQSCRLISGASARPGSSKAGPPKSLHKINCVDASGADHDAPPGEQREGMALDVAQERLDHDPAENEREDEADGNEQNIAGREIVAALERLVGESTDHRRHRQPE